MAVPLESHSPTEPRAAHSLAGSTPTSESARDDDGEPCSSSVPPCDDDESKLGARDENDEPNSPSSRSERLARRGSDDGEPCSPMARVHSEPVHMAASRTTSEGLDTPGKLRRKSLSFGSVNVREYSVELGDNPSVSHGVPVSLGWRCVREASLPLHEYDHARHLAGRANSPHDFCARGRLSGQQRVALALRSGASVEDIRESAEVVRAIQRKRVQVRY